LVASWKKGKEFIRGFYTGFLLEFHSARFRLTLSCAARNFAEKNMTNAMNWNPHYDSLNETGRAVIQGVLSPEECGQIKGFYEDAHMYRNVISMERYRFGKGEYKYFSYPLPPAIQGLREQLYEPLAPLANHWMKALGIGQVYPEVHADFIKHCQAKGQSRPTPLILKYGAGGFNTLHQDLYGEVYFPFQAVLVLSQQGRDFEGGEFVMTEQVPRAQSKAHVTSLNQGDAMIFTTNFRPVKGARGYYRAAMKHGISEVRTGERYALGIIFHDAS
jgi:uncharacterized protein